MKSLARGSLLLARKVRAWDLTRSPLDFRHPFLFNFYFSFFFDLLRRRLLPKFVDLVYEALVFVLEPSHVNAGLLFEVFELILGDYLPNSPNFLHNVKRCDVRIVSDHFGPCLYVIIKHLSFSVGQMVLPLSQIACTALAASWACLKSCCSLSVLLVPCYTFLCLWIWS